MMRTLFRKVFGLLLLIIGVIGLFICVKSIMEYRTAIVFIVGWLVGIVCCLIMRIGYETMRS